MYSFGEHEQPQIIKFVSILTWSSFISISQTQEEEGKSRVGIIACQDSALLIHVLTNSPLVPLMQLFCRGALGCCVGLPQFSDVSLPFLASFRFKVGTKLLARSYTQLGDIRSFAVLRVGHNLNAQKPRI